MDQLRYALTHHRAGTRLVPRPWFTNPWTGAKLNFPQPIVSRAAWTPLAKLFIADHGLRMDATGKIAQRSVARVVAEQIQRDKGRSYLAPIAEGVEVHPTVVVLGADGFTA